MGLKRSNNFAQKMRERNQRAQNEIEKELVRGGKMVEQDARSLCRSPTIARSLHTTLKGAGTVHPTVTVGSPRFFSLFYEMGTKKHEILPKRKKALSFAPRGQMGEFLSSKGSYVRKRYYINEKTGEYTLDKDDVRVTLVKVDHPGETPQPYLHPALDKNRDEIRQMLRDAVRKGLRS